MSEYLELPYYAVVNMNRDACPFIKAKTVGNVGCMLCKFNYGADKERRVIFCDFNMEGRTNRDKVPETTEEKLITKLEGNIEKLTESTKEDPPFIIAGETHLEHDFTVDGEERSVHLYEGVDEDVGLIFFRGGEKTYLRLTSKAARATMLLLMNHFVEEEENGHKA